MSGPVYCLMVLMTQFRVIDYVIPDFRPVPIDVLENMRMALVLMEPDQLEPRAYALTATSAPASDQTQMIRTEPAVKVTIGEEAHLTCILLSADMLQVTWQKVLPEETVELGYYNELHDVVVSPAFQRKVTMRVAGLQDYSLVILNVTKEDQCCYRCLFNTYLGGRLAAKTCLQVYEHQESTTPSLTTFHGNTATVIASVFCSLLGIVFCVCYCKRRGPGTACLSGVTSVDGETSGV